jgi:hypothetical protein
MENEFLKIYSNLGNYHITKIVEFLKSESGTKLLEEVNDSVNFGLQQGVWLQKLSEVARKTL